MPITVGIDRNVDMGVRAPFRIGDAREHAGGQLRAVEPVHQLRTVVAVEPHAAVRRGVQPHAGAPSGGTQVAHWPSGSVLLITPVVSPEAGELVGHHRTLEPARGSWFGEGQVTATCAVHPGDRTQR